MSIRLKQGRLNRSRNACLGGVCAGIAERYDFDSLVIRILALLIALATVGIGAVAYVVLWIVLPLEPEEAAPYEVAPEQAESATGKLRSAPASALQAQADFMLSDELPIVSRLAVAVCLMLLFMAVACGVSPMVTGSHWWQFWPIGLLICGLCLVVIPLHGMHEIAWHAAGIVVTSAAAAMLPMSLGAVSWASVPYALSGLWPLVALAAALFAVGLVKHLNALLVVASLIVALFCLAMLTNYALPGPSGAIVLHILDGRSVRLFVSSWAAALV